MNDFCLNQTFGAAAANAFGLDPARVTRAEISPANKASMNQQFAITFEVLLLPEDLERIGHLMASPDGVAQALVDAGHGFKATAREVQHVDTDEPEASGIPPHVWLYRNMLTDLQRAAPLGKDETNGQYAVAIEDLTDEQRAIPHVATQLALMEADRAAASTDRLAEAIRDAEKLLKTNTST